MMTEYEKYERYEMDEFDRSKRYERYEHPMGSYLSYLTRPDTLHRSKVESRAATTSARDAMPPHLLRIADALKARFNARLTYLATPNLALGKAPVPPTAEAFTEYVR